MKSRVEFPELKFLRTIRFDPSDDRVYGNAAKGEEWAIPGGFVHARPDLDAVIGKERQAFRNGFLSVESLGFSTFTTVSSIDEENLALVEASLGELLATNFGAPDWKAAKSAAREEIRFVLDLCNETPVNSVFAVSRELDENGEIRETFSIVKAPGEKLHARVWEIVEDRE